MRLGRFMLGLAGIMCVRLVWDKTTAFHSGDALLTFMLWLGLLEGAAALVLLAARPAWRERVAAASGDTRTRAAFGTVALGMLTPAILVLWLNQGLDASPGKVQTPVVGAKWVNSGRSGRTCLAYVTADIRRSPLLLPPLLGDVERIRVPCADYDALQPGRSTLTLAVHPGAFGLPWYDGVSLQP